MEIYNDKGGTEKRNIMKCRNCRIEDGNVRMCTHHYREHWNKKIKPFIKIKKPKAWITNYPLEYEVVTDKNTVTYGKETR